MRLTLLTRILLEVDWFPKWILSQRLDFIEVFKNLCVICRKVTYLHMLIRCFASLPQCSSLLKHNWIRVCNNCAAICRLNVVSSWRKCLRDKLECHNSHYCGQSFPILSPSEIFLVLLRFLSHLFLGGTFSWSLWWRAAAAAAGSLSQRIDVSSVGMCFSFPRSSMEVPDSNNTWNWDYRWAFYRRIPLPYYVWRSLSAWV